MKRAVLPIVVGYLAAVAALCVLFLALVPKGEPDRMLITLLYAGITSLPALAGIIVAVRIYARHYRWLDWLDGEPRCRKCRHILRGLTEPRCPECGEPI